MNILVLIVLEITADVKMRRPNDTRPPQHERHKHPTNAPISIRKWVQRFKLKMSNRGANKQRRKWIRDANKFKKSLHPSGKLLWTNRDEADDPRGRISNIVLCALELSRGFRRAALVGQQLPMNALQQRWAEWITPLKLLLRCIQRTTIEDCLDNLRADLVMVFLVRMFSLILQNFIHRADRPFHSRRDNRFLITQRCKKYLAIVHSLKHLIIPGQGTGCAKKRLHHSRIVELDGWKLSRMVAYCS